MKWVNPTGLAVRGTDPMGNGAYGAPRGEREHKGTDYLGVPGQTVLWVCDGKVVKIGYPYSDDLRFRYVAFKTSEGHYVRQMYVNPDEWAVVGNEIIVGREAGTLQALHGRYPQIKNHCHIDIKLDGQFIDPETVIV